MGYNGRVGPKALTGECPIRSFYPVGADLRARRFARKCRALQRIPPFDNIADMLRRQSRMDFPGGMCYHESHDFHK